MGTAPNGWQTPKTDWANNDAPVAADFNRIEGNSNAIETGDRTVDQTQTPTGHVGTLRQFLDWIANRIKAITGETNWYDAPDTTLTAAKSHIDAAAPHSGHATTTALLTHTSAAAPHTGHETPTGAQTKVNTHAAVTSAHSATSEATANRIMMRDASGRAKVAAPSAADDVARKDTVDAKFHATTGHKHTGVAGDGPLISHLGPPTGSGTWTTDSNGNVTIQHNLGRIPIVVWTRPDYMYRLSNVTTTSFSIQYYSSSPGSGNYWYW